MTAETRSIIRKWLDDGKYLYLEPCADDVNFEHCALDDWDANVGKLADAIELAERERCAKIAEAEILNHCNDEYPTAENACLDIAAEIRKDHGCDPPQAEMK